MYRQMMMLYCLRTLKFDIDDIVANNFLMNVEGEVSVQ